MFVLLGENSIYEQRGQTEEKSHHLGWESR